MKIYTKKGDQGHTGLIGGTRVSKGELRIEAYGTVDELNSYVGLIRSFDINASSVHQLIEIQDRLFTIGSSLASDPEKSNMKIPDLNDADVEKLEDDTNFTAREFKIKNYLGSFGIISSITNPFCDGCNRIRLTANGKIKNCFGLFFYHTHIFEHKLYVYRST